MSLQGRLKGFLSDTIVYGVGSMFSRALGFFLIPLYTRHLDKAQYANIILLQLIFTVLTSFQLLTSGVFFYYYEYKNEDTKKTIFSSWLAYEVVLTFFILLLSFVCFPWISPIFEVAPGETFLVTFILLILQLFPFLVFSTYFNLLRINLNSKKAVLLTCIDAVLAIISVVYFLVFAGMGVRGVMLGQLIAKSILAIGILAVGFYEYLNPKFMSWAMLKKILAYSYPFFFSSTFLWIINSSDKIMGTQLLASQAEVAYLGLAMQITMPIMILASIISQAYGPYVMSIKHEEDATHTYREILSLVVYASVFISVGLLAVSPFLVNILADKTFYPALEIIPLFALATVVSLIFTQICLGLNLSQKTVYIAIATIAGGTVGVLFNLYLQPVLGIKAAGYAQIVAYSVSSLIAFKYSQKFMPIGYDWKWTIGVLLILAAVTVLIVIGENRFAQSPHLIHLVIGGVALIILGVLGESKYAVRKLIAGLIQKTARS